MKKILYCLTSLSHKRCFETFMPIKGVEQLVVGPKAVIKEGIVPEDYSDFKLPVKIFNNINDIQSIIDNFKPDIYVKSDMSPLHTKLNVSKKCKTVFVSHGMIGNHVKDIIKHAGLDISAWKGCDLYCGASKAFGEFVKRATKVKDNQILLNALPQLDILYDSNYYNSYRSKVLDKLKFSNPNKIILFVGFCCKDRFDFYDHNEDYFGTAIHLAKWAEKNNHLLMIKPRHTYSKMMKFLKAHKWGKRYLKEYPKLLNNKNVHFITTTGHIFRYFFADAIVINGCSTVEVEACTIRKPLFLSRTMEPNRAKIPVYDPYSTDSYGAAIKCDNYNKLIYCLDSYFNDGKYHRPDKQEELIKHLGISFDGKMYKRIQNKLLTL